MQIPERSYADSRPGLYLTACNKSPALGLNQRGVYFSQVTSGQKARRQDLKSWFHDDSKDQHPPALLPHHSHHLSFSPLMLPLWVSYPHTRQEGQNAYAS